MHVSLGFKAHVRGLFLFWFFLIDFFLCYFFKTIFLSLCF
jgi:hypothetical protein